MSKFIQTHFLTRVYAEIYTTSLFSSLHFSTSNQTKRRKIKIFSIFPLFHPLTIFYSSTFPPFQPNGSLMKSLIKKRDFSQIRETLVDMALYDCDGVTIIISTEFIYLFLFYLDIGSVSMPMSFSSNGTSSSFNVEGALMGSRPTGCVYHLLI